MSGYNDLIARYTQEADTYAAKYGLDPSTKHNGEWDAFRHAYSSGAMAREYGETTSNIAGYLNEIKGDLTHNQPAYEKNMDLWNNSVGRNLGKNAPSNDEIARRVNEALKNGKLITNPKGDGRSYYDEDAPISEIQDSFNTAQTTRSPLILDLDGDGVETIGTSAGIHFDHDGNKFAETTGWVGKDDGLLVWDQNGNGVIDGGLELFGNSTALAAGGKASNGFKALADLDSNHDSKVDASDAAFGQLRVWKDGNSDGFVQAGELLSLHNAGVKSLNTSYTEPGVVDANGDVPASVIDANSNQHRQVGSYTLLNGTTAKMEDVWFKADTARTVDQDLIAVSATIAALPEVQGFGNVHSLQQAMARDTSGKLQTLVTKFVQSTDPKVRQGLINELLYRWAGVQDVDPNSRAATQIYGNAIGDARKLATLETFLGQG